MDVNKCFSLFISLEKLARREAVSKLINTLEFDEFQVVLGIVDHQLDDKTVVNGNVFVKKEVKPESIIEKLKFENKQKPTKKLRRPISLIVPFEGKSIKRQGRSKSHTITVEGKFIKRQGRSKSQTITVEGKSIKRQGRSKSQTINVEGKSIKRQGRSKSQKSLKLELLDQMHSPIIENPNKRGRSKFQNIPIEESSIKEEPIKVDSIKIEQDQKPNYKRGRPKTQHVVPIIPCPCCKRTFKQNSLLKNHMLKRHTDSVRLKDIMGKVRKSVKSENNNACQTCGREFKWHWLLEQHISIDHENIRPFVCDICAKTFKLMTGFKKHLLIHQDMAHSCDLCEKRFRRKDHMINHKRRHTGEHPFKCDKCDWTGPDSSSNVHHKKKHL